MLKQGLTYMNPYTMHIIPLLGKGLFKPDKHYVHVIGFWKKFTLYKHQSSIKHYFRGEKSVPVASLSASLC